MEKKELLNGLIAIKDNAEYELKFADPDSIWERDAKAANDAISIVNDPSLLKKMSTGEAKRLAYQISDMKRHSESMAHKEHARGEFNTIWDEDVETLAAMEDFLANA